MTVGARTLFCGKIELRVFVFASRSSATSEFLAAFFSMWSSWLLSCAFALAGPGNLIGNLCQGVGDKVPLGCRVGDVSGAELHEGCRRDFSVELLETSLQSLHL